MPCPIWLLVLGAMVALGHNTDHSKAILKPGYGVAFEPVGRVVVSANSIHHIFNIRWPKSVSNIHLTRLTNCSQHEDWRGRCDTINTFVERIEEMLMTWVREINDILEATADLFPKADYNTTQSTPKSLNISIGDGTSSKYTYSTVPAQTPHKAGWAPPENNDPPVFPGLSKADGALFETHQESEWEKAVRVLEQFGPGGVIGRLVGPLGNCPGPGTLSKIKSEFNYMMRKGVAENTRAISRLRRMTLSMGTRFNESITKMTDQGATIDKGLKSMEQKMNEMRNVTLDRLKENVEHVGYWYKLNSFFLSKLLTEVINVTLNVALLRMETHFFQEGCFKLLGGKLSPELVPEAEMRNVINHLLERRTPGINDNTLISTEPKFYYSTGDVMHVRLDQALVIVLDIPLKSKTSEDLMTVYRVDTYRVPRAAGTKDQTADTFSQVQDLPTFLAVSDNKEEFIELKTSLYLSCGGTQNLRTCLKGSPRRLRAVPTCAFAIFMDHDSAVKEKCTFTYSHSSSKYLAGSAVQLTADQSFLVHAPSLGKDHWNLACDRSQTTSVLNPCSMCRLTIPCQCRMMANDYFLGYRLCANGSTDLSQANIYYSLNKPVITNLFPSSSVASLPSYRARLNKLYEIEVPQLKLNTSRLVREMKPYVTPDDDQKRLDLHKILDNYNSYVPSYLSKLDAMLAKVTNMSDVVSDRADNIRAFIAELSEGVFGKNPVLIFGLIFSIVAAISAGMLMSTWKFVPAVISACLIYKFIPKRDNVENSDIEVTDNTDSEDTTPLISSVP